jgi:hypothetical protein
MSLFTRAPVLWVGLLLGSAGCEGAFAHVQISGELAATVPAATEEEQVVTELGFGSFGTFELADPDDPDAEGVKSDDIVSVELLDFTLETLTPAGADMSFLEKVDVFVVADGLEPLLIASMDAFGKGITSVPLELRATEIGDYVVADDMQLDADVWGRRPDEKTKLNALYTLRIGVTLGGVVRASQSLED